MKLVILINSYFYVVGNIVLKRHFFKFIAYYYEGYTSIFRHFKLYMES